MGYRGAGTTVATYIALALDRSNQLYDQVADRTIIAEQVLRDVARARTFSVVRVVQTEALASQVSEAVEPSSNGRAESDAGAQHKPDAVDEPHAVDHHTTAPAGHDDAATPAGGTPPPEKVIGINLPNRHAAAVLEAIQQLEGGGVNRGSCASPIVAKTMA